MKPHHLRLVGPEERAVASPGTVHFAHQRLDDLPQDVQDRYIGDSRERGLMYFNNVWTATGPESTAPRAGRFIAALMNGIIAERPEFSALRCGHYSFTAPEEQAADLPNLSVLVALQTTEEGVLDGRLRGRSIGLVAVTNDMLLESSARYFLPPLDAALRRYE